MIAASAFLVAMPVLLLAWTNGANDISRGIATLIGSGVAGARRAVAWGTLCVVLGGLAGILWGSLLAANFSDGLLAAHYRPDLAFAAGAALGAFGWVATATALGMPVSTTHVATGALMGIRFADRAAPAEANALKGILVAWIVTLPAAALLAALATWVFRYL